MRVWPCVLGFVAALLPLYSGEAYSPLARRSALPAIRNGEFKHKDAKQQQEGQNIRCSSEDGEKHYCEADTRRGAHLVRQLSQAPCKKDESWGYDEEGIWVDKGCSGEFALGRSEAGSDARAKNTPEAITCASEDGLRKVCPVDTSNGVQLVRQRSDAKCKEGTSWGQDGQGIWVDKGCQADFVVGVPGHPAGTGKTAVKSQTISCASLDGRRNYCDVDTQGAQVRLTHLMGSAACLEGSSWGYDRSGIWVDRFCNAEFLIQAANETPTDKALGKSCLKTVGKPVADELVRRCLQVSVAKPTPCSAQNSCQAMEDEIQRRCEALGGKAPALCGSDQ